MKLPLPRLVLVLCMSLFVVTRRARRRSCDRGPRSVTSSAGEKLFALGKFDEALDEYQKAYDAKPLPDFLFNIGQCHRNLGDYEAAIFSFKKFLKLDPEAPNRDAGRGVHHRARGRAGEGQLEAVRVREADAGIRRRRPARRSTRSGGSGPGSRWSGLRAASGIYAATRPDGPPSTNTRLQHRLRQVMRPAWLVSTFAVVGALPACAEESYLVVTVETRPSVHDAATLRVTLTNAGTMRTDELPLGAAAFPATFSVSAPGRERRPRDRHRGPRRRRPAGRARDPAEHGRGRRRERAARHRRTSSSTPTYADDQFPSDDFEAHGYQVSSGPDGTWTVAYRDRCAAATAATCSRAGSTPTGAR